MANADAPREPHSGATRRHPRTRVDERAARVPGRHDAGRGRAVGALLLVLGMVVLIQRLVPLGAAAPLWPLALIVPGAAMVLVAALPGRDLETLAVPGALVTMLGLVLGLQELTGRYDTWSYAWGLIPASIGLGRWLQGAMAHDPELRREGARLALIGGALFAGFGLYFEGMAFRGLADSWLARVVGPVALIVAGLALLVVGARRSRRGPRPPEGERPRPG